MNVREMIETLKKLPQDLTVATHPAGLAIWMESWPPTVRMICENGQETNCEKLAKKKFVCL